MENVLSGPIILAVLAWVPGLAALAWQAVTWSRRHQDASKLERMKGDIQRDVQEHLAAQETRLRVASDLKLRLHDRSWQLLRDLIGAAFDTHRAIVDLSFALAAQVEDRRHASECHERLISEIAKLQVLAVTAPPEESVDPMMFALKGAAKTATEMVLESELRVRVGRLVEARREADQGLVHAGAICKRWGVKLWQASERLPEAIVKVGPVNET
jgi:hypothetical protein